MTEKKKTILTWISCVAFAALLGLWGRSIFRDDNAIGWWVWGADLTQIEVGCASGRLTLGWAQIPNINANFIRSALRTPSGPVPHLSWLTAYTRRSPRRSDLWFSIQEWKSTIPTNADGSIGIVTTGTTRPVAAGSVTIEAENVEVPLWLPLLLTVGWPLVRIVRLPARRRRHRIAAGLCVECGYDLRASFDQCPECGAGIVAARGDDAQLSHAFSIWARCALWALVIVGVSSGAAAIWYFHMLAGYERRGLVAPF
jgi:hypothetical protein